tara:strand:- start:285 stop:1085 length:801 start_codon:yes stop_codon:yes gene_type:complete
VCLGAGARAANERMKRNYEFKLQAREREWMRTLSLTNVERMEFERGIDASNLGLANVYSDIQEKHGEAIDAMFVQSQEDWKTFLAENTGDKMMAAGQLGKSRDRISAIELGQYLKKGNDQVTALMKGSRKMSREGYAAAAKAKSDQARLFAQNVFIKNPDMAPPPPVYQDVGAAAFQDALGILGSAASTYAAFGSDRNLKENIKKIGESISGLGIYKFNYIGKAKQYIGTMSDEVKKVFPEAVVIMANGYEGVRYDLIDVQFKEAV